MKNYKLSEESAREQLEMLLDYYELDPADMQEGQEAKSFEKACDKIVKAIRLGRLEIDNQDGIKVKQNLRDPAGEVQSIEYAEIVGRAKTLMKTKQDTDQYGRIYVLLGSLSGLGETAITSLKGVDLSLAECLGVLFLAV